MSKLRVWWIPQAGATEEAFYIPVETVEEGREVMDLLAAYDAFQLQNRIKLDYCNCGGVQRWEDSVHGRIFLYCSVCKNIGCNNRECECGAWIQDRQYDSYDRDSIYYDGIYHAWRDFCAGYTDIKGIIRVKEFITNLKRDESVIC